MKRPNFFIIGAPKSGTTALSEYLRARRDVFFSTPKEPNHFNVDFSETYRKKLMGTIFSSDEKYTDTLFGGTNASHLAVGEGSPWYLISKVAPERIRSYNPGARIIVLLRNPVSLAPSMHSQELFGLDENVKEFEHAWKLQEEREHGKCIPSCCTEPQVVQYRSSCMLGVHMKRLYDVFPRDQVLPILFDKFIKETHAVYGEVLDFLNLPADGRTDFPKVNPRKEFRSTILMKYVTGDRLNNMVQKVKRGARIDSFGIKRLMHKFNVKYKKPAALNIELRRNLFRTFSSDIELLEKLLGWNLDQWRKID